MRHQNIKADLILTILLGFVLGGYVYGSFPTSTLLWVAIAGFLPVLANTFYIVRERRVSADLLVGPALLILLLTGQFISAIFIGFMLALRRLLDAYQKTLRPNKHFSVSDIENIIFWYTLGAIGISLLAYLVIHEADLALAILLIVNTEILRRDFTLWIMLNAIGIGLVLAGIFGPQGAVAYNLLITILFTIDAFSFLKFKK